VVVTDDSGCGEVIRSTGGGEVVQGSESALRAGIEMVLRQQASCRGDARAAAAVVRRRFSADAVGAQLEDVYADVVRSH